MSLIRSFLFTLLALVAMAAPCMAQTEDTTAPRQTIVNDSSATARTRVMAADTVVAKKTPFQPNPKKAGLYSALVPGMGQLYNRQYWKMPIVYAGLGIAAKVLISNIKNYQSYRKAYINRINNPAFQDEYTGIYSPTQLQQLQDDNNRYVNLTVLFGTLGYAMQILDAITAAHLKNFDISRDISMRMQPVAMPLGGVGMGLVMNF